MNIMGMVGGITVRSKDQLYKIYKCPIFLLITNIFTSTQTPLFSVFSYMEANQWGILPWEVHRWKVMTMLVRNTQGCQVRCIDGFHQKIGDNS